LERWTDARQILAAEDGRTMRMVRRPLIRILFTPVISFAADRVNSGVASSTAI
jgi:hypothetical protein